nr:phage tail tape measure protein [uncultured Albidiferax sp.]
MANRNVVDIVITAKDQATSVFTGLTTKLTAVAAAVAGYFGVGFFRDAIKGAADLEAGMSRIQAASGASAQEMVALKAAAADAGAATKYTSTEAASALETLIKAGLDAKDAIGALPAVLNLAQAGDIALATASEYVTKAVKGMGLEFSDAGRVADVLAMGANASSTSVTGLAEALSYTAPVALSAKLSLEQTVAILGKFADAGIDASRGGTALNSILSQFIDPASKFRQELAAAGIVTTDFDQALRQLAAAGPKGQLAIQAVGLEAGPALRALLNQGIGSLDELKAKLDGAAGSAANAAAIMEGNLNGSLNSLSSAWDTVKNALGEPLLPVLTDGVKQLSAALSSAVSNGTIGQFGQAFASAFQSAITWAKTFAAEIDFTAVAAKLNDFATRTGAAFDKVGEYATNAGNTVQLVYGVMSAGTNAVLSVVYGLGSAFAGVASNIQSGLALLLDGLSKVTFGSLSQAFKTAADEIRVSAEATWASSDAMGQKAEEAFNAMADGAQLARDAYAGLTTEATSSTAAHQQSAAAIQSVATALQDLGDKAPAAAQKQITSVDQTREAVAQLRQEYDAAMAAGDIQAAAQKQQLLRNELGKTAAESKVTKEALQSAFDSLGITSQAKLKEAADSAQNLFNILKSSGQATAVDLQNAFAVVAQRTLDAAGPIGSVARATAQAALEAKAAADGLSVAFDSAGKVVSSSMGSSAAAVGGVTTAVAMTNEELQRQIALLDTINAKYGQSKADFDSKYGKVGGDGTKTSDGQKKNADGSAAGTFGNTLVTTDAFALVEKAKAGKLSASDLEASQAAYKQAQDALQYMQALGRQDPGGQSAAFVESTMALYNSTRAAYERVQALAKEADRAKAAAAAKPASTSTASSAAASSSASTVNHVYTVKVVSGGKTTSINTADEASAKLLADLLQAKGAAGL